MTPDTPHIKLGHQAIEITFTGLDIRARIFRHYHQAKKSAEHQKAAAHGMPLVTKTYRDPGSYWVTLFITDLPDIACLDEPHGRYRGIPLQQAIDRAEPGEHHQVRSAWHHEHFINAIWEGSPVRDFTRLFENLIEVLGPPYTTTPVGATLRPYGTAQDLIAIGSFLQQWPARPSRESDKGAIVHPGEIDPSSPSARQIPV